jgi:RNA polymerase subunit RPABC4/transcription elongation factor Spt4
MNHRLLWWDGKQWQERVFTTPDPEVEQIAKTLEEYGVHTTIIPSKKPTNVEGNVIKGLLEDRCANCGYSLTNKEICTKCGSYVE